MIREVISDTQPMIKTEFFKWLEENSEKYSTFIKALKGYLNTDDIRSLKSANDIRNHKGVYEHYYFLKYF